MKVDILKNSEISVQTKKDIIKRIEISRISMVEFFGKELTAFSG